MADTRVTLFPIQGLEYVFVPPGLPLAAKTQNPTTSILVRGGAGTGKTTVAVALAHAISKQCGGVALYMLTEFVATELVYKSTALHLPDNSVLPWDSAGVSPPGTIFVRHLLQTLAGKDDHEIELIGQRKHAAIEAVWESVAPGGEPSAERPEGPPLRAVVIDAFGLPGADGEDPHLRNELLTLVQSLEYIGISVILVEESSDLKQTWLSFVVDIVFELELAAGEDSGNLLLRQLRCPKSRYGQALPGPHDYGLDLENVPAVWPDLAFANAAGVLRRADNLAPTFFVPQDDHFGLYDAGSIIISDWSAVEPFHQIFTSLPGARCATVRCGPITAVNTPSRVAEIAEGQGILALVWMLIFEYHKDQINAVVFQNFEWLLSAQAGRRHLRAIKMLGAAGISICLHGDLQGLAGAVPVANLVQGGKHQKTVGGMSGLRYCRADRWLKRFAEPGVDFNDASPPPLSAHLSGKFGVAHNVAKNQLESTVHARYLMLVGRHLGAARILHPALRYPADVHMWKILAAIVAGNTTALEQLARDPAALDVDDTILLLRALAAQGHFERLDAMLESCRARWSLDDWYVKRLRAELHIDLLGRWDPEACKSLEELALSEDVPAIHRAEIYYNLAVLDAQRDPEAARAARQRARELNPEIDLDNPP